ncbi:sporulation protein [Methanosarcinales archaeon]|nr:MAG: sporulation protein [Methanosarcinales archaeon]
MLSGILKVVVLTLSLCIFTALYAARIYYVLPSGEPKVEEVKIPEDENPFSFIFNALSNPPVGCLRLLPEDAFRAIYVVRDTLYLDMYSESFTGYSFDEVRYLIHSLMSTIFSSFEGIKWVKLLLDGHDGFPLAGTVEITYMFSREVWQDWPVQSP